MVIHKLEWDEIQFEISNRILRPCRCLVCGTPYLSQIDEYSGIGNRCPIGHEQFEHYPKCVLCDYFDSDHDYEYGYSEYCENNRHNLKGWPFMRGCKNFASHRPENHLAAWNKRQILMDEFAKMRKENAKSKIIIQG